MNSTLEKLAYKFPGLWRVFSRASRDIKCFKTWRLNKRIKQKPGMIRILFIIYMPEVWTSLQTVYEATLRDDSIEGYIIAQPRKLDLTGENSTFDFIYKRYPFATTIDATEGGRWFDIKSLEPDYVFYTRPYSVEYYGQYRPSVVRQYAATCYIPYGFCMIGGVIFDTGNNGEFLCNCSYLFNGSKSQYELNQNRFGLAAKLKLINNLNIGFPRFDLVEESVGSKDPFTILWTPRFPTPKDGHNRGGHFLSYLDALLAYASEKEKTHLIIRPHPLMFERFVSLGLLSTETINEIKKRVENTPNVEFDSEKDYHDAFDKAALLVTDFSSLMAEFFATTKPIVHLDNAEDFLIESREMDRLCYHANEANELVEIINILREGNDDLYTERKALIDSLITDRNAGTRILQYLTKQ